MRGRAARMAALSADLLALPAAFCLTDTATTEIYTLSLHDALPISQKLIVKGTAKICALVFLLLGSVRVQGHRLDRKCTRLNSSHSQISYAVFCLKKKSRSHSRDVEGADAAHAWAGGAHGRAQRGPPRATGRVLSY